MRILNLTGLRCNLVQSSSPILLSFSILIQFNTVNQLSFQLYQIPCPKECSFLVRTNDNDKTFCKDPFGNVIEIYTHGYEQTITSV